MKKITLLAILLFYTSYSFSQEKASVEKSIWGIQIGLNPLGIHNESRLTNKISLRSEIGFGYGFSGDNWAVMTQLMLEPRYYYNLKRRNEKNKQTKNNSGNYLSLNLNYLSGDLSIKPEGVNVFPGISIIPMYGLRRNIGENFNFEFAFGVGYGWTFQEYQGFSYTTNETYTRKVTEEEVTFGLRLSIGYVFKHRK